MKEQYVIKTRNDEEEYIGGLTELKEVLATKYSK